MAIRNIREEKTTSSSGIKKVEGFVQTQTSPQGAKVVQPKVSTGSTVSSAPKTEVKSVQPTIQTVGFSSVRKSPATKVSDTITNVRPITSPVTTPAAPTVNANASKRTVPGQNINNVNNSVANARQRQSAIVNPVTNPGAPLQKAQVSNVQKNDAGSKGKLDSFIDATGASIASNYARNIANLADMAARADKGRAISDSIKTDPDNFNASLGLMQSMPSREELAQTGMTDEQIDKALNSLNGTRASDTSELVSEGMGRVADQKDVEAERNSRNLNRLENFASRSISGAINQAPQMILNMAAPGSGDLWIAATSYADAVSDAESRGIDSATAAGYGAIVAGIEVASNYISSANKFDPKGILDDWQDALVANSGAKGGKALLMHYALNVLGEQIEEETATIPEFLVDYFMLKGNRTEDGKFDWKKFGKEIWQTFIDTLGSTVVLGGLTGEYSRANANDFLQSIEDYRNADPYQSTLDLVREAVKSWDKTSQEDKNLTLRAVADMNGEDPAALSDRIEEAVENAKANGILETESKAEESSEASPENTAQENPAQNEQDTINTNEPVANAPVAQEAPVRNEIADALAQQDRTPISEYEGEQIFRSALDDSENAMPVKAFGKRLGRDIVVVEDLPLHANGVWMDGKIYIPESVIRSGKETWTVVRHELTHSLRGAKVFDKYINYAVNQMRTQMGDNWENYYNQKVQDYSRAYAGAENFDSLINEEIAAEYTQEYLFNNQEAVNQLVRSSRSTAQRIWQTLKDMARKLTGIDSPEAAAIRRAERMFAQAIAETNESSVSLGSTSKARFTKDSANPYSYENLVRQGDVAVVRTQSARDYLIENGKLDRNKVIQAGIANAKAVGFTDNTGNVFVVNDHNKTPIKIGVEGIRHGLEGNRGRQLTNAEVGISIGNVVKAAIPINELSKTDNSSQGTYIMVCPMTSEDGSNPKIVTVTVDRYTGNLLGTQVYDALHSANGRKIKKDSGVSLKSLQGLSLLSTDTISVEDLLPIVKSTHQSLLSDDVLAHYGEEKNPEGYYYQRAKYSLPADRYNSYADIPADIEGNYNQTDLRKQEQYSIIANSNPADDDYHTWIRSASDIKTYEEALQEDGWVGGNIAPDYTEDMIEEALYTGNITVYSSYPIGNGVFVTPSKIEAQNYAGSGQVYSTTVPLKNIAWIDSIEGQYADTGLNSKNNSSTITSRGDDDVLDERGLGLGTQQRQGENAEVGKSDGRTDSDSVRNFDGILLRKWERLNLQQIREISDKLRTIIANNEEAKFLAREFGGVEPLAETIYRDYLQGSVVAEQWKPRIGEIQSLLKTMREVGAPEQGAFSDGKDARLSIGDSFENAKIPERRLDSIANSLKRQFNTKMDINDLKQTIGELYDMYDMDLTEDERREVFRTMAREMESQIPESKRRDAESQGVLEKLKERPISLTESQRSEIVHTFGSMNDFRKEIAPLKLRSDGIDLETAWKDWSNSASTLGMFDSEVNPLDMPAALVDLVERLKGSRELIDHDDRVDQIVDYLENAYQESVFEEPDIDLYEAANGGWNTKWEQRDPTDSAEYKELMGDDNDGDIPLTDIRSAGFAQQIQGNKGMSGFDTLKRTLDKAAGGNQQIREWFQKVIERPLYDAKAAYTRNRITAYNNLDKVVNEYGIKAGTKESAAVQWYGEGYRVNDDGTRQSYTLNDLKQEFPDTWQNIQKMEQWCRNQYNEYVDKINGALESIYPDVEEKALAKLASLQDSRDGLVNQARSIEEHIRRGETSAAYSGDTLAYVQRQISDLNTQIDEMERSIRDGSYLRNKRLIPRTDYFHHFNEVSNKGIGGLKNLLRGQMTLIDTELVGKSDTTKPKSKWMSFLQSRGNGEFTADAVGGMAKYMPGAEFVIAMDPAIAHMRAVIKELATSTKKTRNANGLISYLTNYTNDIAGKTAGIDRSIMNLFGEVDGRAKLDAIRRLNSRFKANAVGGNIRSALAQFSNIPTAMGVVKSESAWIKGLRDYLDLKVKRSSDLLDSSEFMTERYFDDSIDRFTEDSFGKKIKQFSNALLEFGDREAAQWIWFSAYEEALEQGVEDPVFYADQATQQSVGGRGVGEVPYNMSTKVVNLLAPFQVEVNNTWQQMKKMVSEKDAKGLMRFMIGSFVMESMMEQVFGIDVIPDFLGTMIDTIIGAWREKDEEEPDYQAVIGNGIRDAIGEIIGAIPGASLIAPVIFGIDSDTGEALFGEGNPSRYGTGLGGLSRLSSTAAELVKAGVGEQELGDVDLFGPMVETLLPFGGRQLTRTYQTAQDLGWLPAETWGNIPFAGGEYREVPGSYTNSGALRFELPSSPETPEDVMEMARALMLGEYSTQAGREYLETRKPQVSASKMEKVNEYAGAGYDPQDFIDFYASVDSNGNGSISQAEAQEYLDSTDLDNDQKLMIWTLIGPNWKKNPYA